MDKIDKLIQSSNSIVSTLTGVSELSLDFAAVELKDYQWATYYGLESNDIKQDLTGNVKIFKSACILVKIYPLKNGIFKALASYKWTFFTGGKITGGKNGLDICEIWFDSEAKVTNCKNFLQ